MVFDSPSILMDKTCRGTLGKSFYWRKHLCRQGCQSRAPDGAKIWGFRSGVTSEVDGAEVGRGGPIETIFCYEICIFYLWKFVQSHSDFRWKKMSGCNRGVSQKYPERADAGRLFLKFDTGQTGPRIDTSACRCRTTGVAKVHSQNKELFVFYCSQRMKKF